MSFFYQLPNIIPKMDISEKLIINIYEMRYLHIYLENIYFYSVCIYFGLTVVELNNKSFGQVAH